MANMTEGAQELIFFIIFLIVGLVSFWTLRLKGVFHLQGTRFLGPHLTGMHLCAVFGIVLTGFFVLPLFFALLTPQIPLPFISSAPYMQIGIYLICSAGCVGVFQSRFPDLKRILRDRLFPHKMSLAQEIKLGFVSLFTGFFLVAALSIAVETFCELIFGPFEFKQNALRMMQEALQNKIGLVGALVMALLFAPVFEEFISRGILQTYLRRRLSPAGIILTSALVFSLFHIAADQGISNIPLCTSLFLLALFLGF